MYVIFGRIGSEFLIGYGLGMLLAVGAIALGLKGLQPDGLPLTKTRQLKGPVAAVIGIFCITLGVVLGIIQTAVLAMYLYRNLE